MKPTSFSTPSTDDAYKDNWAYVVGLAIGDGNLSNPNGRAVRLRITCDIKYPLLIEQIKSALQMLLPNNKVSSITRDKNCIDVYVYSNTLENLLDWQVGKGSKFHQRVRVPQWIRANKKFILYALKDYLKQTVLSTQTADIRWLFLQLLSPNLLKMWLK